MCFWRRVEPLEKLAGGLACRNRVSAAGERNYGGLKGGQARRLRGLELKRMVSELMLDKLILKKVAEWTARVERCRCIPIGGAGTDTAAEEPQSALGCKGFCGS